MLSLYILLLLEDCAENESYKWTTVEKLIEESHWKVHGPCLDPCTEGVAVLEKECGDKAHCWAHDATNANGDCICYKLRSVGWLHYCESKSAGDFSNDEKLKHESDRYHDWKLVKSK